MNTFLGLSEIPIPFSSIVDVVVRHIFDNMYINMSYIYMYVIYIYI